MATEANSRPLAVVTGASTGIGLELAKIAAAAGYDLVIAADKPEITTAAAAIGGTSVEAVIADLSTRAGVDTLVAAIGSRAVDILCANAGTALGHAFLEQPLAAWRNVVDTNVTGTLLLLHAVLPAMVARGGARVLVSGSINGSIPGPYLAVYNASKAFLNSFTDALRNKLRDADLTLTTLMPGPVDTPVYARADMLDTVIGKIPKPGPENVAQAGWDAMMKGEAHIIPGILNKVAEAVAHVVPAGIIAAVHEVATKPR